MSSAAVALGSSAFDALDRYVEREHYRGWEFDDLLASPIVRTVCGGNLFLQRCAVQLGRLSPINLRPLLGVPKLDSAKANAFFARGYLHRYAATGDGRWLAKAQNRLQWLVAHPSPSAPGVGWGNHFDFASRGGFFPKHLPTVVWTAHIGEAFALAHEMTGEARHLETIHGACEFVLSLERTPMQPGVCIAYAPGIPAPIHNSNLLGAQTLLLGWKHFGVAKYRDVASEAYQWTLARQKVEGSWYYGEGDKYRWIDNFHTAYILDSLVLGRSIAGEALVASAVIERAYDYWRRTFFDSSGRARYYADRAGPLDIQCAAQAIETLSGSCADLPGAADLADRVLGWTLRHFQKPNGAFRFRAGRWVNNDLESIHWGESTMLSALGRYLRSRARRPAFAAAPAASSP